RRPGIDPRSRPKTLVNQRPDKTVNRYFPLNHGGTRTIFQDLGASLPEGHVGVGAEHVDDSLLEATNRMPRRDRRANLLIIPIAAQTAAIALPPEPKIGLPGQLLQHPWRNSLTHALSHSLTLPLAHVRSPEPQPIGPARPDAEVAVQHRQVCLA